MLQEQLRWKDDVDNYDTMTRNMRISETLWLLSANQLPRQATHSKTDKGLGLFWLSVMNGPSEKCRY